MTTLVTLVGEQALPALSVARTLRCERTVLVCTEQTRYVGERLAPLTDGALLVLADAYRIDRIADALRERLAGVLAGAVFDVTGGTKPMSLAAFGVAAAAGRPAVYLRTTGMQPVVSVYHHGPDGAAAHAEAVPVPRDALTLDDYLRAYAGGYDLTGPATDDEGRVNEGGRFELAVAEALRTCCDEVLVGVKPAGLGQQVDLDLVVRRGTRVGVVECKLARDRKLDKPKQGLDQLMQATDRAAFGSHVVRMLVLGAPLNRALQRLADDRRVEVAWVSYRDGQPLHAEGVRVLRQVVAHAFDRA